jgi:large subunit ribosomal protein LP0
LLHIFPEAKTMSRTYPERKVLFCTRLREVLGAYKSCLVATIDFVGSNQLQKIRKELRGKAVVVMGKKTMMRQVIRTLMADKPELERLLPFVTGNVGLIWTNADVRSVRDIVVANKVPAAAKPGQIAPLDVIVPPGPTSMDPGQTSFFQALNIATKISRGAIEILNPVHLIHVGDRCDNSACTLLQRLGIKPFAYGMKVIKIYDEGFVYDAAMLDVTDDVILGAFREAVTKLAALSLRIGYPTAASVPHSINNAFRNLVALSIATDYTFDESKDIKALLSDPEAMARAARAAAAASAPAAAGGAAAKTQEAPKEEPKEEEAVDLGMSLFD